MAINGKFFGHSALITGTSDPTGFALAKLLVSEGCQIHMADYNEQALKSCFDIIKKTHNAAIEIHHMDLSEPINISVLALECQDANIVINTMDAPKRGGINQFDHEEWKSIFQLTLFSAISLTGEILDNLYEKESGIIINLGGGADVKNLCTASVNSALQTFSETLDKKTKLDGIRVLYFLPQTDTSPEKNATILNHLILKKLSL